MYKSVLGKINKLQKKHRPPTWSLDATEGSVESSNSYWSAIAHAVIKTCIINVAGRQDAHKKQRKYTFVGRISPNDVLYSCFVGIYKLSTQKKNFLKNHQNQRHYTFKYIVSNK